MTIAIEIIMAMIAMIIINNKIIKRKENEKWLI